MSRYYTDDPLEDFKRYDADRESAVALLPECEWCGRRIQDEHYYEIDGILCDDCLNEHFRKSTVEYMG